MSASNGELPLLVDSFVGRRAEQDLLREMLTTSHAVTLTGPGGVGKTRLAKQVAASVSDSFRDGVVVVELADVSVAGLVASLVADRLGLIEGGGDTTADVLLRHLAEREMLLVLDNCEHLIDACADLVDVLSRKCPKLVILATSRQSLAVAGERVVPVRPLPGPETDEPLSVEQLGEFDAMRLFLDRARAKVPDFAVSEENAEALGRMLRRLDGMPLAIELAAARLRSLSPSQIVDRLDRSLALLTSGPRSAPERHQTLRASIDGSHELCTSEERKVWARASVFAGSFDLAAAESVCGDSELSADEVLFAVDGLVDKSVVLREGDATQVRFRLPEPLREYGREQLVADQSIDVVARRHRDHFASMVAVADREWLGPKQQEWTCRLREDLANLRAAMEWSITTPGEAGVAVRMATQVDEFWTVPGRPFEARTWMDRALAASGPGFPGRAAALSMSALYALYHSDLDLCGERLVEATDADTDGAAAPHIDYVRSFLRLIRSDASAELAAASVAAYRERGDVRGQLQPLFVQGISEAFLDDLEASRRVLRRMIRLIEESGEHCYYRALASYGIAIVEVYFGDVDEADRACREALLIDLQANNLLSRAYHTDGAAWIAARRGEYRRAASLFGAADRLWQMCFASPFVSIPIVHKKFLGMTREALGQAAFDRAYEEGRVLTLDEATALAMAEAPAAPAIAGSGWDPLTRRECQVAKLVADGLTNREIAEHLVIALRTADTHVQNILTKLDFTGRAQIAAWAAQRSAQLV